MEVGKFSSGEPVIKARLSPKDQEEFMVLETDTASFCETSVTVYHYTWSVQVLRSPKEAFAAAMQSWREHCEKCVCLQSD